MHVELIGYCYEETPNLKAENISLLNASTNLEIKYNIASLRKPPQKSSIFWQPTSQIKQLPRVSIKGIGFIICSPPVTISSPFW